MFVGSFRLAVTGKLVPHDAGRTTCATSGRLLSDEDGYAARTDAAHFVEGTFAFGWITVIVRKQPMQQRSQQLVESLVEAAGRVVAQDGLSALTTIRVAERAGVSVGSLYQYFENKEALLSALVARMNQELRCAVDAAAPHLVRMAPQAMVRGLLEVAFDFFGGRDGLHTELLRNWHRIDIQQGLHRFEQHMLDIMRIYALAHVRELRLDPQPAQGFIIINSVVFTLLRYLSLPRAALFSREQLIDELSRMIAGTMLPMPTARAPRRRRR